MTVPARKTATINRGKGVAKKQPGLSTELEFFPMATVTKIAPKAQLDHATMNWLNMCLERGKSEEFTTRVLMTPGVANALLERNPDNRNVSPTKVGHYATDMAAGRWQENGETIIVSSDGLLNDGQHRMQAVIDSNAIVPFLFVFGVSRASRTTVDQGAARGASHYLSMLGIPYATNAATAAKFIMAYERSAGRNISARTELTNGEVCQRVIADDEIGKSAAFAYRNYKHYRTLFSHTVMTACHYILAEIHAADAETFLDEVAVGEGIKRGDPAFAVRQAFMNSKRERQDAMGTIFHGWNAYRQGRSLKAITAINLPALV